MKISLRSSLILTLLLAVNTDLNAQSSRFEAGIAAMNRGRYAVAFRSWLPLAEAGMPEAQLNLGELYQSGQGVDLDLQKALYWYEQAAAAGLAEAHLNIGVMYLEGLGVEIDVDAAFRGFQFAADQDLGKGKYMLGKMLFEGLGVEQNMFKARTLFLEAAKTGFAESQFAYAYVVQSGAGAVAPKTRFSWLSTKKDLGDPLIAFVWSQLAFRNGFQTEDNVQLSEIAYIMMGKKRETIDLDKIIARCIDTQYADCPTK
jgi:TPR repeat protein